MLAVMLLLSGCMSSMPLACGFAGSCEQTEASGKGITGAPRVLTTKTSKIGLMATSAANSIGSVSAVEVEQIKLQQIKAEGAKIAFAETQLTGQQVVDLAEDGERAYFEDQKNTNLYKLVYAVVDRMGSAMEAMSQQQSSVVGVTKAWMSGISNVSQDSVGFTSAIMNPLSKTFSVGLVTKGVVNVSDNQREQAVVASEYGGDMITTITSNQGIGDSSNDPSSASGAGGSGGMGPGGSGGGSSSNSDTASSNTSNDTYVIAGRAASNATDDAAININGNLQDQALSANGTQLNDDARAGGTQNNDNNDQSPQDINDADGTGNDTSLF
jgi:hypothetical protein